MTDAYRRASLDPSINLFGRRQSSVLALPAPPTPAPVPLSTHHQTSLQQSDKNGHEKTEKLELISSTIQLQFSPVFLDVFKSHRRPSEEIQPERLILTQELGAILSSYKLTRFPLHRLLPRRASIAPITTEKVRRVQADIAITETVNSIGKCFASFTISNDKHLI